MPDDPLAIQAELPNKFSTPKAAYSWYTKLLGFDADPPQFVANVFIRLDESLQFSEVFGWLNPIWRAEQLKAISQCCSYLAEQGLGEIAPHGNSQSPVHNYVPRNRIATLICQKSSVHNETLHVLRVLLLHTILDPHKFTSPEINDAARVIRQVIWKEASEATVFDRLAKYDQEDFLKISLGQLHHDGDTPQLTELALALDTLFRAVRGVNVASSKAAPGPVAKRKPSLGPAGPRPMRPGRVRPIDVGNTPFPGGPGPTVSIRIDKGPPGDDVPDLTLIYTEPGSPVGEGAESSSGGLAQRATLSRNWLRHFGNTSPASKGVLDDIERERFIAIAADYLSSGEPAKVSCGLAYMISFLTPFPASLFLFEPLLFQEVFDSKGHFFINTVQTDVDLALFEQDPGQFRDLLTRIHLALPVVVAEKIVELKALHATTFAEALGVSRKEFVLASRIFIRGLTDKGRYRLGTQRICRQFQLALADITGNTAATFTLSASPTDMYPILLYYWGGSEEQLQDFYLEAAENMLRL